ncbi:MAG: SDR family NAD(P)-dependent oxidoreductase [Planctomycetia bacterium]|nr:SDR family NAD(P)-dependent oxidoreductase [Planctomycetia bacterium]
MSNLLKNKVAIITGGGRGIGKAIAERFAQEGCNLMLVSRTKSELEETAESIKQQFSVNVSSYQTDIGIEDEVESMVLQTIQEFDKIDILVNNAAIIGPMGEISKINGQKFLSTLKNNIGGTVFCTKAVLPYMKSQKLGCIINLSGGGGLYPLPYYDAYSASKAAIVRLTENFALELEKYNVNVTAISPGAVNTKMFDEQLKVDKNSIGEKNWLELQDRLFSGGAPIDKAPELALFIACQNRKEFNGRVISAIWDDWENISNQKEKIIDTDIFQMRRIVPKDRDLDI